MPKQRRQTRRASARNITTRSSSSSSTAIAATPRPGRRSTIPQPAVSATQQVDLTAILEAVREQVREELRATANGNAAGNAVEQVRAADGNAIERSTPASTVQGRYSSH